MINNPKMTKPSCRFRKEKAVQDGEDPFEEEIATDLLSQEIVARTDKVAGKGDVVSAVPIILRVEYCYCANLTIWDMPGTFLLLPPYLLPFLFFSSSFLTSYLLFGLSVCYFLSIVWRLTRDNENRI